MFIRLYVYMFICLCLCLYANMFICLYAYTLYMYMFICSYFYLFIVLLVLKYMIASGKFNHKFIHFFSKQYLSAVRWYKLLSTLDLALHIICVELVCLEIELSTLMCCLSSNSSINIRFTCYYHQWWGKINLVQR